MIQLNIQFYECKKNNSLFKYVCAPYKIYTCIEYFIAFMYIFKFVSLYITVHNSNSKCLV